MAQHITQDIADSQSFLTIEPIATPIDADIHTRLQYFMKMVNFVIEN